MENQLDHIKFIKTNLKENGFTIKNNLCYKFINDILCVVFFHKRLDGGFNTEMGISPNLNNKPSIKNMDILETPAIGINIKKEEISKDYNNGLLDFILNWFEERNSIKKIKTLYESGKTLGYCISPEFRKFLQK